MKFAPLNFKSTFFIMLLTFSTYLLNAQCSIYGLNIQTSVNGNTVTANLILNGNLNNALASSLFFDIGYSGNSSTPTITTPCNPSFFDINANNSTATFQTVFDPSPLGTVFGSCGGSVIATLTFNAQPGECIDFTLNPFNSDFYIDDNTGAMCTAFIGQNQQACVPNTCETYGLSVQTQLNGNILTADLVLNQNFSPQAIASFFDFGMTYSGNSSTPTGTSCLSIIDVNNNNASVSFSNPNGLSLDALFNGVCTTNVIATLTFTLQAGECVDFFVDNNSHYIDFTTGSQCPPLFGIGPITECAPWCEPYDLTVNANVNGTNATIDLVINEDFTLNEYVPFGFFFMDFDDINNVTVQNTASCLATPTINNNNQVAISYAGMLNEEIDNCPNGNTIMSVTVSGMPGHCITVGSSPNSHFTYWNDPNGDDCYPTNTNSIEVCFEDCSPYDLELTADVNGCDATVDLLMPNNFIDPTMAAAYNFRINYNGNSNTPTGTSCLNTPSINSFSASVTDFDLNNGFNLAQLLQNCANDVIASYSFTGQPGECVTVSISAPNFSGYRPLHDLTILCEPTNVVSPITFCFEEAEISGTVARGAFVCETEPMQNVEVTIEDENGNVICVTETDADGNYSCTVCPGDYNVYVSEVCDEACAQVTLEDTNILRQIILGILPGFPTYNSIFTSDVNGSGGASTLDIVIIERMILGLDTDVDNWCNFIPSQQVQDIILGTGSNSSGIPLNDIPDYTNNQQVTTGGGQNTNVDFTMYALGDVNGNCCDENYGEEGIKGDPDTTTDVLITTTDGTSKENSEFTTTDTQLSNAESADDIVVIWPYKEFSKPKMSFSSTSTQSIAFNKDLVLNNIYLSFDLEGDFTKFDFEISATNQLHWLYNIVDEKLLIIGQNMNLENPITIKAGQEVVNIKFNKEKGTMSFTESNTWNTLSNENQDIVKLNPTYNYELVNNFEISNYLQSGNKIEINALSSKNTDATIEIIDIFGNVVYSYNYQFSKGTNEIEIANQFRLGVFVVHIYNEQNRTTKNIFIK